SSLEPSIPREMAALILRLLAKKPSGRPASADEVRAALAAIKKELDPAAPLSPPAPSGPQEPTAAADDEELRELRSWSRFSRTTLALLSVAAACAIAWWFLKAG
ncbi:MAG: hypothetical protein ACYC8T_02965, partial [Myxococcaceae bacterium]